MTKKITIAALLCAVAAYFVYPTFVDAPGNTAGSRGQTGSMQMPEAPTSSSLHDPDQELAVDDGAETVLGIRVRKDRNCTVELKDYVTPDGEMFSAYSCEPDNPGPAHPYAHYDDDTLDVMAYADAEAAALLGKRLLGSDARKSYQLLIRASALDGGKVEHIAWLADQAFGPIAINGAPQVSNLKRQYELAVLAARLGDISHRSEFLRNELIRAGVDADQLNSLDARVETLFQSMRDIQKTVLGEITIGGPSDA